MTDTDVTLVVDGDELSTLLSTLDRIRRTFAWKCGGLDADGLRVTIAASTMTLGGLLKHLAYDAGQAGSFTWPDGRTPNLRRIIADMIEEYARHTGHADLLREAVDGLVGEDAPA
jgi:hypothetical protein